MTTRTHRPTQPSLPNLAAYAVPRFYEDFREAPDLEEIGTRLAEKHHLIASRYRIRYLWKRKGGSGGGNDTLGKTTKASGLVAHFADTDFVIWLGADNVRIRDFTARQVEALVYHELLHITETVDQRNSDDPKPALRGHEVEMFFDEVTKFGPWKQNLETAALVFNTQLDLPL